MFMITNGMKKIEVVTESKIPLIKKLFKNDIKNFFEISHFSLILITSDKRAYIASASREFSDNYSENGFHKFDNTMCPLMYDNLDFYSWAEGYISVYQKEISAIKKEFGLNNGTVFVRRLGEYTLLYCVATKKHDPIMKTIFVNHANSILQLGDYCYNQLINDFAEHSEGLVLPKIEVFKPFLDSEIPCLMSYENSQKKEINKVIKKNKANIKLIVNNTKLNPCGV